MRVKGMPKIGGRKKGTPNKASVERQAAIAASGKTPLEYMIAVLNDPNEPQTRHEWAAEKAAPYVHPRLASTEVKSETTVRYVARVPEKAETPTEWLLQHSPDLTKH